LSRTNSTYQASPQNFFPFSYGETIGESAPDDFLYVKENHLGSVLATVSDRKLPVESTSTPGTVAYYLADVTSATDMYSGGMQMPGRSFNSNSYRYGHNTQEKDDEIFNGAYTAEFWEYDARTLRRWNLDPVVKPWRSGYDAFDNTPIWKVDPNGDDDYYSKAGTYLGRVGEGDKLRIIDKPTYGTILENKGGISDFEKASHVLTIQDAGQKQYIEGLNQAANSINEEHGAFIVLDFTNEEKPVLRFEQNTNCVADDISISHKTASLNIQGESVKVPVTEDGVANKNLIIVGEIHTHDDIDKSGNKVVPGVSQSSNSSGGNDVKTATTLKVPVYAVDKNYIHKVDQKGKVEDNKSKDTNVLKDALESKGEKKP